MVEVSNSQPQSHTGRNFCIAAGAGATLLAANQAWHQKKLMTNQATQDEFLKNYNKSTQELSKVSDSKLAKWGQGILDDTKAVMNNKKYSPKLMGISAAIGAVVFGGIYLAAHGIKSLFKSKEAE